MVPRPGDYIFATVYLGQNSWAANNFWKVASINYEKTKEGVLTSLTLASMNGKDLQNWPLAFIDIHEIVNRQSAGVLYGQ